MRRSDLDRLVKEAGLATAGVGKALAAAGLLGAGAYGLSKLKKKRHAPMMGAEGGGGDDEPPPAPTGNRAALEEAMKYGTGRGLGKVAEELSAAARKHIKDKNFALPDKRYPIEDKAHARNALARAAQHASPDEKAQIKDKVHKKYPGIGKKAELSTFRAAFVDELIATGVMKVADHPEPFIDQQPKGVSQEDQQEFGHGKGMGKKKPKESSLEEGISAAAKKLASLFSRSPMPAPAAAGAVLDDLS